MLDTSKLFTQYYEKVLTYASQLLHNTHDAEDVAMSVFEAVVRYPNSVSKADNIEAYLIQMTRHAVARLARYEERQREVVTFTTSQPMISPENEVVGKEVYDMIIACMCGIENYKHRKACYFFHIEHATYLQIADKMEISYQEAQSYVRQGTNKLREILAKEGIHAV